MRVKLPSCRPDPGAAILCFIVLRYVHTFTEDDPPQLAGVIFAEEFTDEGRPSKFWEAFYPKEEDSPEDGVQVTSGIRNRHLQFLVSRLPHYLRQSRSR